MAYVVLPPPSRDPRSFCRLPFGLAFDVEPLERARCGSQAWTRDPPWGTDGPAGDSPRVQKPGAQDHDGLARALLQLHLDGAELAVDDADHALDLLWGDGPGPALLPQEVHHVGGKLVACLERQDSKHWRVGRVRAWTECCVGFSRDSHTCRKLSEFVGVLSHQRK